MRCSQWEVIVHVFSFLAIFILSLMTLATEQTKNMFLLAERERKESNKSSMESIHFIVSVTICSIVEQSGTLDLLNEVDA